MRSGFAISFIGHVAVVTLGLFFAGAKPFDSRPAQTISVDIVSPDDIRPAAGEPGLPEATPAFAALTPPAPSPAASAAESAAAWPYPALQPSAQAKPRLNPAPVARQPVIPPQPFELAHPPPAAAPQKPNIANVFGLPLTLPDGGLGGGFDAPAIDKANISADDITTFREHLKTCLTRPESIAPTDKIRVVLRVFLKPDGMLAATPTLIEASASTKGPALMESVIHGLQACQPYAMLPANKYPEWKVLDLSFTPLDFAGG
jgi:hypothetical protein